MLATAVGGGGAVRPLEVLDVSAIKVSPGSRRLRTVRG